ncbi:hypothetical protein Tco_0474034 [Tanacetum coccineum]
MEDPNITMEDYIKLEEEKAHRHNMALPPRDQRHQYLRFEGLEYTDVDIADFEKRLGKIYSREVHRVLVLDFERLPAEMAEGLTSRMLMEHRDAQGQSVFTSHTWRRLFEVLGPLVFELIMEFFSTFRFGQAILDIDAARTLQFYARQISDKGDLSAYWRGISSKGDFLGTPPSYTLIRDPMMRLCHRLIACSITGRSQAPKKVTVTDLFYLRGMDVGLINIPYMLARYLRRFASGRKQGSIISRGQFITRLAEHFGLLTEERLQGLTVALGLERQPDAAAGAPRLARVEEEVHEIRGTLGKQREVMDAMARDLSRFTVWAAGGISQLLDSMDATYVQYSEPMYHIRDVGLGRGLVVASTLAAPT